MLSFSKNKEVSISNFNFISVGERNKKDFDFIDFEGRSLERYRKNLKYLIRPDEYIVGIFKDPSFKTLERYMF